MKNHVYTEHQRYERPSTGILLCDNTCPILDSPGAGFGGDEGGLEIDELD